MICSELKGESMGKRKSREEKSEERRKKRRNVAGGGSAELVGFRVVLSQPDAKLTALVRGCGGTVSRVLSSRTSVLVRSYNDDGDDEADELLERAFELGVQVAPPGYVRCCVRQRAVVDFRLFMMH
eukprot:CAMPEP_0119151112 /NCGR_PEP_ID=MMETSP1310-20130426/45872_1 /TAXON_ID=464262 /ORGANISM="Genus nov. species nov., Strain RCC2339" /LENGTH=125 /DNA_ID=CAMNT_0007143361 /DNA_START=37 /DNA_END=411 /DNA_ORIENTATION=+